MDFSASRSSQSGPQTAEGTLVIMVCRAKHLPNRRKLDKQSPYVTLRLGTVAKKTPSHFRAGQTPDWTHEVRFQLSRDRKPIIRLDVLDETKNDPTPIGTCEIDCSVILGSENERDGKFIHDKWYELSLNGRRAGMIYLEMTFYPSAPVLPPKLYENIEYEQTSENFRSSTNSHGSFKNLPSPPPQHPSKSRKPSVVDDIFVNEDDLKKRNKFFQSVEDALGSSSSSVEPDDEEPATLKNKYLGKFNRFTKKFQAKEPITTFWGDKQENKRVQNITPFDTEEFDNLDDLQRDIQQNRSFQMDDSPPSPPAHSVHSFQPNFDHTPHQSPQRRNQYQSSPPKTPAKDRTPGRKPPPGKVNHSTTAIPFSADTIGITDEDELPTKVYFMDEQVKSLSYSCNPFPTEPIDKNEIDPKYYAPTPNEHFGSQKPRFRDVQDNSGYIGNGKWKNFSPSIFDRIPNDKNLGFENKPNVPPKIPQGLSEREYFVLEKEKYLKDINGRRS
ncbi:hypothetical protein CLIB1444_04S02454 [[Candida] jaroonii]|uniref:Uncharacterized protein n=1 Tax=[Candida] jaroonii TaxID=467808 RepID=A0ACA9Y6G9_9ASCO|nr:hypothetical protein CLIB1444_04S02454 [[Candida] jaroonii]